jgi:hypothetical protein
MPLWFEIAVLVLLAFIADAIAGIRRNTGNLGIRLETEILPRLEAAMRKDQENEEFYQEPSNDLD